MFIRAGAIIPAGPQLQFVNDMSTAPELLLDVYPGPNSSFTLYEDNGSTMDYQSGAFLRTQIANSSTSTGKSLQITKQTGSWVAPPRAILATMHGEAAAPSAVLLNGTALPMASTESSLTSMPQGWYYNSTNSQLIVLAQDAPSLAISIQN